MQGGGLNCNATNCTHNFNYQCKNGSIDISDHITNEVSGSACMAFRDRAESGFANSINDYYITQVSNIRCESCDCVHNENKGCYAYKVNINGQSACCDTYRSK